MSLPNDIVPDRDEARRRQAEDPLLGSAATAAEAAGLACPDAELLGLYAERALPRAEAAAIEAHVQGCARCEDVVTAIVRALPVEGPSEAAGAGVAGWLRGWRWMVPALSLAGAAAVAFWLGRGPAPVAEMDLARTEAGPGDARVSAADDRPPSYQVQQERAKETALPVGAAAQAPAPPAADAASNVSRAAEAGPAAKRLTESTNERRDAGFADRRQTAPAAPTVVGGVSADAARQTTAANAAMDAAAPAAPAPARMASAEAPAAPAAAAPAPATSTITEAAKTTAVPAEREERARVNAVGATAQSGATAGGAAGGATAAGARAADLRAPFDRWRVRNGRLEFARDGKAWRRVTLPTSERVTSVTERPDGTVLVITASGAQFVSANLGATWERQ